ncbi:23S rRNA-intervening sequence protein [Algoriphagus faecimaris]|uniref:23S rRNA-intervening sequence protein n=1 Tax=Algoriphagus faecimaris TaxID=686796 RepID=A0A1G6THV6_9BACT|nr:four helix bundle protein [Algoriphagus faecimaris]SDD27905.1 23S rRNA-intervening sequence protein [Algoriphagus faecimaris]
MHNFKALKVWKEAVDFAKNVYSITKSFPAEENTSIRKSEKAKIGLFSDKKMIIGIKSSIVGQS